MNNLTPEQIAKAKAAKSAAELLEIAKANNVELTENEAQIYFTQMNAKGSVADDELDAVAGGICGNDGGQKPAMGKCPFCGSIVPGNLVSTYFCPKCHNLLHYIPV